MFDRELFPYVLKILQVLRILTREVQIQETVLQCDGAKRLGELLHYFSQLHFRDFATSHVSEMIVEIASILRRLALNEPLREELAHYEIPEMLSLVLGSSHPIVSRSVLETLHALVRSQDILVILARTNAVELLLRIISEYSSEYTLLAVGLLNSLCASEEVSRRLRLQRGTLVILNQFNTTKDTRIRLALLSIVQTLSLDMVNVGEFRMQGMVPALLPLLTPGHDALLAIAALETLTAFALEDESSILIRTTGAHVVGRCVGKHHPSRLQKDLSQTQIEAALELQLYALRLIRFLYSLERNRKTFRKLFPHTIFASFIDIGNYKKELSLYTATLSLINSLSGLELEQFEREIEELAESTHGNNRVIGGYTVMEMIGKGGFGCVFEVMKGESRYALKEIPLEEPATERSERVVELSKEVAIYKDLNHPNIIKYYSSFVENGNLYIVMELADGQTLSDYITSLREKGQRISEGQLWRIFIEMCAALRYLHVDKHVVHRDFTPANILITRELHVKIADFGLAKQWGTQSSGYMKSFVGTIVYTCPEIVQSKPYNEKADIWALGCVLYELATLQQPFSGENPLAIARKIVEEDYVRLSPKLYSLALVNVVKSCMTVDPEQRPSILEVCQLIAPLLMMQIDELKEKEVRMAGQLRQANEKMLLAREPPLVAVNPVLLKKMKDPLSPLLETLYKLVYISQLPPGPADPRRSRLETFKHWLFAGPQVALKQELAKLQNCLREEPPIQSQQGVTYEVLNFTLEELLIEAGYYSALSPVTEERIATSMAGTPRGN